MDSEGQFNVSHLLGSTVDVAHYSSLQHRLQGYRGTIATVDGHQGTGTVPPAATITLGYSVPHSTQSAAAPPYSVTLAPQVSAQPQIQYYYEAAEPLTPHLQVRYSTSAALSLQPATPSPPQVQPSLAPRHNTDGASQGQQQQDISAKKKGSPGTEVASIKQSRKHCRNHGKAYTSASGKSVPAKKYVEQECQCRNKCLTKLGTTADREAVFRHFWDIGDFEKQNTHLAQSVVLVPNRGGDNRRRAAPCLDDRHLKTVKRIYYVRLQESRMRVRVCKSQFLRLHGVSNGRLDRVLQALHCRHPHALQDRRGQHTPSNKTAQEDLELAAQHILELQQQTTGRFGAAVTLEAVEKVSVKKMHELYRVWCAGRGRTPVSLWVYRQVKARLAPLQEGENHKDDRVTTSLPDKNLLLPPQSCPTEPVGECLAAQEVRLGPEDTTTTTTTTTTTDSHKRVIISARSSEPTITNSSQPAITTTDTATVTTSITTISPATTSTTTTTTTTTITTTTQQRQAGWVGPGMSREERKMRRNKGEAYVTSAGKVRDRRVYRDEPCQCRHRCIPALGTPEARQHVFDSFWDLASFTRQNAHIARMVTLAPLNHRRNAAAAAALTRTYSRVYRVLLKDEVVRVCKLAFLRLHGVSNGRVDRVLQAVACQSPFALKDRRGRHTPYNKTQEEDVSRALRHMCTLLVGESGQSSRCPLPRGLSVEKMYRLYRDQCVLEGRKPVGSFVYRKILKESHARR